MSGQGYVQTILVDCNRISSIEYNASKLSKTNNALYTNKISDGITLDIGDKVSVASAHIAQRGAGSSVIEFGGEVLGHTNISYCETISSSYIGFGPESADNASQQSPTGYAFEKSSIVTEQVAMKDNEVSIVIDYYKNANGENYITLPRNHGNWGANQSGSNKGLTDYPSSQTANGVNPEAWWEVPDGFPVGCIADLGRHSINICFDDFRYQVVRNSASSNSTTVKLKNDNSRFTLFKKTSIVWNFDKVGTTTRTDFIRGADDGPLYLVKPDPAIHEYIRFKEKKVISVDEGYNSPSNIASNITDELVATDNPTTINFGIVNASDTGLNAFGTGQIVNSALHKALPCANYSIFNSSTNKEFFQGTVNASSQVLGVGQQSSVNVSSSNHLASYAYVGFKRPDFIEAGRASGSHAGYEIKKLVAQASFATAVYETNIPWTDDNLKKFSKLFDRQKDLYPELLNGGIEQDIGDVTGAIRTNYKTFNTTSTSLSASFRDEARFVHCALAYRGALNPAVERPTLGSDHYNSSGTMNSTAGLAVSASNNQTTPFFFYFNKNCSDLTADQTTGDRYDNLAYGWARQWKSGADKFIAFTTELIGGIPQNYFDFQNPKVLAAGTRIGYDYHFSAYGNAAIMPSSGYFPLGYYGHQGAQSASLIRNTYIGADNPLFNFNSIENRFELSNLHTPEKVGNFFNAGAPSGFNDNLAPPPSAQGTQDCYKLNKQLNYSTWSPSMFPYPKINNTAATAPSGKPPTDAITFIEVNENLEAGAIFDSRSGVTILDSGVDETNFERSLWGTLGFNYSQFNTSGSNILNSNTRFTEDITNVSGLTTNANIISTTAVNYPQNAWGIQLFTAQINSGINYYNASVNLNSSWVEATAVAANTPNHVIRPPSTILATSTTIAANKLPRKLKTGYFTLSSDILDQTGWYHQANTMSVLGSVGKYSAENDFVEYGGGGPEFTVTRKKTITAITSQILDPLGQLAQVGDNSGIIYRIDKQINTDLNFAENVMNGVYKGK